MNDLEWQAHSQRLAALVFDCDSGRIPDWLSQQAQLCAKRYAGLHTTPEFETALKGFSQRGSEPFELFVVGEGKFGKSTLINALLGEEVAKVHVLPETRTFHRLILSRNPSKTARLLVHIEANQHEWLCKEIGPGKPAQGFFEVMEHRVPLDVARSLLAEESGRVRKSKELYKPAIFELEEEILWTPASPFPEQVRIVDTQGLNQQLPEDLQQSLLMGGGKNTAEKVINRLNQHVRGRHMLWQYRRCDAALWLLRATKIESAATNALFDVFSAYGKKTLLIVTHIDAVSPRDYERIMRVAEESYRNRVDAIVPVNGKQALEGALKRTGEKNVARKLEDASGLSALRSQINDLCVVRGLQTKVVGLYNALRATESDLRRALTHFLKKLSTAISRLEEHRQAARDIAKVAVSNLNCDLTAAASTARSKLHQNIQSIGFWDNGSDADEKMAFRQICAMYQQEANSVLKKREGEINELAARLQKAPYALPVFDPLGNQAGESVTVKAVVSLKQMVIQMKDLHVHLDRSILDGLADPILWIGEMLLPKSMCEGIREERQRKRERIYCSIHIQCDPKLENLIKDSEKTIKEEFRQGIKNVESAIGRVEERLASVEREPLPQTRIRLEAMLAERAMKSALAFHGVSAFRSLALKHQCSKV